MKISRKIHTLIALVVALLFALAQTGCGTNPILIDFTAIKANVVDFIPGSGPEWIWNEDEFKSEYPYNLFALQVEFDVERLEENGYGEDSADPDNPLKYPVTDIRIITIGNYNERYPDGSIVNDAFGVFERFNYVYNISWPSLGDNKAFITHWYLYGNPIFFVVRDLPTPGEHQFRVEFELSDKRILTSTTKIINFYEPEK